jgi:hypothetical protein
LDLNNVDHANNNDNDGGNNRLLPGLALSV